LRCAAICFCSPLVVAVVAGITLAELRRFEHF
jgi:hypothetical protein